jgi:hypothetical protein
MSAADRCRNQDVMFKFRLTIMLTHDILKVDSGATLVLYRPEGCGPDFPAPHSLLDRCRRTGHTRGELPSGLDYKEDTPHASHAEALPNNWDAPYLK